MKRVIFLSLAGLHLLVLSINIVSKHCSWDTLYLATSNYTSPYFPQEWEMFAPPPTSNTRLYFRFITCRGNERDTSQFQEVLRPLYRRQVKDMYAVSRLSYYLHNCGQNMYSNFAYYINSMPDSIKYCDRQAQIKYLNEGLSNSYSHYSLIEYGKNVYRKDNTLVEYDSVLMSYHLLDIKIPRFENRYKEEGGDSGESENMEAWNSTFYKIL